MEERISLFRDFDTGAYAVSDLCRRYGVSRETFYVWRRRRESLRRATGSSSRRASTCSVASITRSARTRRSGKSRPRYRIAPCRREDRGALAWRGP
ncbi:transposase [Methylocystis sp. MJC1]|uniref:transposase n=1 Tax=Methylocystis sp. MJC1 TaxID=2654282 RepID=UPI0034D5FD71